MLTNEDMITDPANLCGKTIRGVMDAGSDGMLFVFTDGTAIYMYHDGEDVINLDWTVPSDWIGQYVINREKAIEIGFCTAEDWDAEVQRKAKLNQQDKLDQYHQLKTELGL